MSRLDLWTGDVCCFGFFPTELFSYSPRDIAQFQLLVLLWPFLPPSFCRFKVINFTHRHTCDLLIVVLVAGAYRVFVCSY